MQQSRITTLNSSSLLHLESTHLYKNMQRMLFLSLFLLFMDGKWISVMEVEIMF